MRFQQLNQQHSAVNSIVFCSYSSSI